MPVTEYEPGSPFPGRRRTDRRGVRAGLAGPAPCPRWGTERLVLRPRRRRLRPVVVLRWSRGDAEHRSGGGPGSPVREHAHHRAVLAHAVEHFDGPEPPLQRCRLHHGAGNRLSRLRRPDAVRERHVVRRYSSSRATTPSASASGTCRRRRTTPRPGPFHRWPLGRGFERFYGFLGGETNQWYPDLTQDNGSVRQPSLPEDGYHLSEDLADNAIKLITDAHVNAPEKPFFMYYATGAAHAPHHVPKEWADRYAGAFDLGWDAYREAVFARQKAIGLVAADAELSRHDPDVPEWDSLNDDERRLYARMMEVFAGFLSHADHHFGRILDTLERIGELDNTIIMIISDNGASAEGGVSGSFNEMLFFNMVPGELRGQPGQDRRTGRHQGVQPLPLRLDLGRQHPVPALEAGDLSRRLDRPVRGVVAGGHGGARGGPHPVRARDRHGSHRPRGHRRSRTRDAPRGSAVGRRGGQLRPHLRRPGRADPAHHAVLRDVRPSLDRPRRLAGGVPLAGAQLRRVGRAGAQAR